MKVADVGRILSIPISQVVPNPDQPRKRFDDDALRALSASIAENGLLQPVTVRARGDGSFELIAGERRLEATRLLGRREIAAIVVDASPGKSAELALIENIQRADLSPFEQADAFRRLREERRLDQRREPGPQAHAQGPGLRRRDPAAAPRDAHDRRDDAARHRGRGLRTRLRDRRAVDPARARLTAPPIDRRLTQSHTD